jgi:hypothetical protein
MQTQIRKKQKMKKKTWNVLFNINYVQRQVSPTSWGWRWGGCALMYCSSFRNFTFCFDWFLFYFRLLVYICVVGVFLYGVKLFVSKFVCLLIINKQTEYDNLILEQNILSKNKW